MMFFCLPLSMEFVNSVMEILAGQQVNRKKRKPSTVTGVPWLVGSLTGLLGGDYKFGKLGLEADLFRSASLEMIGASPSEGWVAKNIITKLIDSLKQYKFVYIAQ